MATYVVFCGFREQGIRNIKESPARVETARKIFEAAGAKVKDFYLVMGMDRFDTMLIVEAPDDEAIARASLKLGSLGNVHTDSHRAFSEAEFSDIVSRLQAMGIEFIVKPQDRLPTLNALSIPPKTDDTATRERLLHECNIKIGAGLSDLTGKGQRIGLMGCSSTENHVKILLAALKNIRNSSK